MLEVIVIVAILFLSARYEVIQSSDNPPSLLVKYQDPNQPANDDFYYGLMIGYCLYK